MRGNVFIIGLGLIGGSVALAIKQHHRDVRIIGYDVNQKNVQLAKMLGIIDEDCDVLEEAASKADLIIISVPVIETERIMRTLSSMDLKQGVIITDVGSTKQGISDTAKCLTNKGICFIGGHPMAGSHKSGPGAAKARLFENAFYLLTPNEETDIEKIEQLKSWLEGTQANFLVVTPEEHDRLTGVISHFPHIIAAGLVQQAKNYNIENSLVSRLAAGGFRDITRIASSSPVMWRDISIQNKTVLLDLMDDWLKEMERVKSVLIQDDAESILGFFKSAKEFRDELPVHAKGAIPAFYDLYIDVPDYPGIISEITGYFAQEGISITNIRILETREEEIYGVLVVSFQTDYDRSKAEKCIKHRTNYGTFIA
ncbi:prephenate dehydrogenase [Peribacillus cavernae]|uniref:Prephenate dehydrogenase n=1 Tax=Peribacillus cavernae TaxID=1674310 RepID=A0A3S0VNC1_9BACI|nr:prephenate dehydrogenase [Peribacillus cavernae]MDQ0218982.1 prephenate dehydrogenase [Peribacillus cavernae]RUQ29312.1 prephenate dehydrogenase [Peribacillus cavernae]